MLTASRSLARNIEAGRPLPYVEGFRDLYKSLGFAPRHGQVMMIAGRSGTQKSGLALWWAAEMAKQGGLSVLYFSADMSAFTASARLASMETGDTTEEVEEGMRAGRKDYYLGALRGLDMTFSFGSPITQRAIDEELEAFVALRNEYPAIIVLDNLMDFDGAESDYAEQMYVMSYVTELSRATGSTVIILHHASDKSWDAKSDPWMPPSRDQIKGGLSEKPELSLSVALDPNNNEYRIAIIKQRMGPSDPTAKRFALLQADPGRTRFYAI